MKLEGDEAIGVDILKKAIESPLRTIAANAGEEGSVVVNAVKTAKKGTGFDAANNTYVNMIEAGIIDPTKVVRSGIENAASVAVMILTTEAMVTNAPDKNPPMGMPPGGMEGMGGMGGMM